MSTIGKMVNTSRELSVEMTPEELADTKDKALAKLSEVEKLQASAATISADYRARIKIAQKELKDLCESVETKTRLSAVACREDFHFGQGIVRIFRLDSDKFVGERTILPGERQDDIESDVEAGRPPATMPDPGKAPSGK